MFRAIRNPRIAPVLGVLTLIGFATGAGAVESEIISAMKASPTGPFMGVRWYCADGSVLRPRPFACEERGGGRQHGHWSDATRELREQGYLIANVLAAEDPARLATPDDEGLTALTSILIERYLIARDDGWIWRKARYERGILQDANEREAAAAIIDNMLADEGWISNRLLLIREAVRLLPGQASENQLYRIRALSNVVAEQDEDFVLLRNKIHTNPTGHDASAVREFAAALVDADTETVARLNELADLIDAVYSGADLPARLRRFARFNRSIARPLRMFARGLEEGEPAIAQFRNATVVLERLREIVEGDATIEGRLEALQLGLQLESLMFAQGRTLLVDLDASRRRAIINLIDLNLRALHGAAFLTDVEYEAAAAPVRDLRAPGLTVAGYRRALTALARVNAWGARRLALHFEPAMRKLAEIEPMAADFIIDRLRGSPLFLHAELLAWLERDAAAAAGVSSSLFGSPVASGLEPLNPGLAQGRLVSRADLGEFGGDVIVIADETTADLPAVAGIITAGAGNALSHVQLLARNLGVPNVVVTDAHLENLFSRVGETLFLAVSPGGVVRLELADESSERLMRRKRAAAPEPLNPNLDKLDLETRTLRSLHGLRASDSGVTVGPKAAKLGELAHRFPGRVSPGLGIPFGQFRYVLTLPYADNGGTPMITWLRAQYELIDRMVSGPEREERIAMALGRVSEWLQAVELPQPFLDDLRLAMETEFGEEGEYGVFVRSDTNIEDLPNFSGAGLNRTVPNVVGFEPTVAAIRQVWASVFSQRAWGWRQAMIPDPIHVYPAVLLHRSVDVDVSGVMITAEEAGGPMSLAVNEGPGGGVSGQSAEQMHLYPDGRFDFLGSATEPYRYALIPAGGVERRRVRGDTLLLTESYREQLIALAAEIDRCCQDLIRAGERVLPADVEFGFSEGELVLFQIRPLVQDRRAGGDAYLASLDSALAHSAKLPLEIDRPPLVSR